MKILHVISSLKIGGAEQALCNMLAQPWHALDQHIVAYLHDGPCRKQLESYGIPTIHLRGLLFRFDPFLFIRFIRLIKKTKPDVIHSSLFVANILARLSRFFCDVPVICALHGNCKDEGRLRNYLDKKTTHLSNHIIAVADTVKDAYQQHIVAKIKSKKRQEQILQHLSVIKNGIDAQTLRKKADCNPLLRTEYGIPHNAFVIGAVGRHELIKSYDVLINAFALFKQTRPAILMLVGSGSQTNNLKKIATQHSLTNDIIFVGARTDAYRFYNLFDCFALSSHSEGLSIALLEALCFGLPILTTHNAAQHDVICHEKHGLIVPSGDVVSYARALEKLYANPALIHAMKNENMQLVGTQFDITTVVSHYRAIFESSLPQRA